MCFLDENFLQDILDLQNRIARDLPTSEIFRLHEDDYFHEIFRLDRAVIGVTTEDGLIAYSIIRLPGKAEDNLGRDIGLPEIDLNKVAHLQAAVVHPAHRGRGLQRRMAMAHLAVIEDLGYEHVCCTVSPKNPVSLGNIFSNGFVIKNLTPKFEGWWRYIMYKKISCPMEIDKSKAGEQIAIAGRDIKDQVDLLNQGFIGFKMALLPEGFEVFYGKYQYPSIF
jgi:ribosomal protein S18 acetylase RimI-like enzyme